MITQLKLLEQAVSELKERYHITATELINLKNKVAQDTTADELSVLQTQLKTAKEAVATLTTANANLEREIADLHEQNQALLIQNTDLTEKNSLAISRAEVIQNWLAKIDQAG